MRFDDGAIICRLAVGIQAHVTIDTDSSFADQCLLDFRRQKGQALQECVRNRNRRCVQGERNEPLVGVIGGMDIPLSQVGIVDVAIDLEADL